MGLLGHGCSGIPGLRSWWITPRLKVRDLYTSLHMCTTGSRNGCAGTGRAGPGRAWDTGHKGTGARGM